VVLVGEQLASCQKNINKRSLRPRGTHVFCVPRRVGVTMTPTFSSGHGCAVEKANEQLIFFRSAICREPTNAAFPQRELSQFIHLF
jgi:hypothetical protein